MYIFAVLIYIHAYIYKCMLNNIYIYSKIDYTHIYIQIIHFPWTNNLKYMGIPNPFFVDHRNCLKQSGIMNHSVSKPHSIETRPVPIARQR